MVNTETGNMGISAKWEFELAYLDSFLEKE